MPGIADVQPKQISTLGQPLVSPIEPVVTQDAVTKLSDAYRTGLVSMQDIIERAQNQPVLDQERKVKLQQAQEALSPEAIQARQEQQLLAGEKAMGERKTLLTKDFVDAYRRYNLPLMKDGKPDYAGMAEVGQKYADMERTLKFAEMGLAGKEVTSVNERGQKVTRMINTFGEDITTVPGKANPALAEYQKMARKARAFLIQNDNEPEVPEGGTAPGIEVAPKDVFAATPSVVAPSPTEWAASLPPKPANEADPSQVRAWLFSSKALPPSAAAKLSDQEALEVYQSYQEHVSRTPEVVPKGPAPAPASPVVAPAAQQAPPVAPTYGGEGLVTDQGDFEPNKFLDTTIRGSGMYKNWQEKSEFIDGLRKTVDAYKTAGETTNELDSDLAAYALMLSTPGQSASGRSFEGLRLSSLAAHVPNLEKALDLPDLVLNRNRFPKATRDRIIAATERKARTLEAQGRGALKNGVAQLTNRDIDPSEYLFDAEKNLLSGSDASGTPAGATTGAVVTVGGRKLMSLGNGQYKVVE